MARTKGQKSLAKWTKQKWDYVSPGDKKKPKGKRGRDLPGSVSASLGPGERGDTKRKKRQAGGVGNKAKN